MRRPTNVVPFDFPVKNIISIDRKGTYYFDIYKIYFAVSQNVCNFAVEKIRLAASGRVTEILTTALLLFRVDRKTRQSSFGDKTQNDSEVSVQTETSTPYSMLALCVSFLGVERSPCRVALVRDKKLTLFYRPRRLVAMHNNKTTNGRKQKSQRSN